jgi:23S rRNA (uracil1939-C5)-methyltransferase
LRRGKRTDLVFEKVEIIDAGAEGKAVGRVGDLVVFAPFAVPGDVVDIKVHRKKKSFAEGKVIRIHHYSEKRAEPFCEHFGICGGCKWQQMRYEDQLFYKQKQVEESLVRIGKMESPRVLPIIPSPRTTLYRNKLEYTFSNRRWITDNEDRNAEKEMNALGFHIPMMFDKVLDINHCHLQDEPSNAIRLFVRRFSLENKLPFYDVRDWTGLMRNLLIRNTTTGDLMVIVVFREYLPETADALLGQLASAFPAITSLFYVINPKKNDVISDLEFHLFSGSPYITEQMPAFRDGDKPIFFRIGPASFFQTNSFQAVNLYKATAAFAEFDGQETVYDLYTGTGTIANYIAPYVAKVVGIESVPAAIGDAKINARLNGFGNVVFFAGETEKVLTDEFIAANGRPDVIITDPPRSGMHEKVVEVMLRVLSGKIVYVSCNPATQARDLALLAGAYELVKCQPVDMFPHTHHVENVALLRLKQGAPAV